VRQTAAPEEIRLPNHVELTAGVLVIGGGLAGTWAALTAAQHGADVVLVDKGYCGTSGVTATAGVGHWYLPPEAREAEVAARTRAGGELTEPDWMYATMETAWRRLPELDPYYPWPARDDGRPNRATSVRGPEYLRLMRARVRRAGVTVLDHHPATELLAQPDGTVAGADGLRLQEGGTWSCRAAAVILATGGTAFLSRLLGANNNTADGHLMAAEAGARFAGMEFSCYYTLAPANSTMTRSFPFMYGTYRDCEGNELAFENPQAALPLVARALTRGPVTVVLDRMPQRTRDRLRHVQPNFLLPLLRSGIDPFTDPFPVTLRGEGTIRGTGGIALAGRDCQAGVEGLYAAGDVASRQPIVGASSGGGQPNSAWCVASGTWSGQAAARRADTVRWSRGPDAGPAGTAGPRPLGQAGLRPGRGPGGGRGSRPGYGTLGPGDIEEIRRIVGAELNAPAKNMFRTAAGLTRSRAVLDDLWARLAGDAPARADTGREWLRAREAAALVAAGRWVLNSALTRQETRGMHHRTDAPDRDPALTRAVHASGLDTVRTEIVPLRTVPRETVPRETVSGEPGETVSRETVPAGNLAAGERAS
jgi:succinate dehydrogenase/fumarate reductase flavoprotein subunit